MHCYVHDRVDAVGVCAVCQKATCRQCVGRDSPRLVCRACVERRAILGFEYRSSATIGEWPLVHICMGVDATTMRPRVAKGVIAIGNIAVGGIAIAGVAFGIIALGGLSAGLLLALGGAALGLGLSMGGVTVGSIAIGGVAIGFVHALGGVALGPSVIDGRTCDAAARDFIIRWVGASRLPPSCF
jgi:hypothetical protein